MELLDKLEVEELTNSLYFKMKKYCADKYITPVNLRQLYRQYCKWRRAARDGKDDWALKHQIKRAYTVNVWMVHYLLERCFWTRYGDTHVVSNLLTILFEVDGHLGYIFDYRLLNVTPKHTQNVLEVYSSYSPKSTWKNEELAYEALKPLDYFIEHAYKGKVLFNGKRLAEQCTAQAIKNSQLRPSDTLFLPPCALSFQFPDVLLRLLQYGLFVRAQPRDANVGKLVTGILGVLASGHQDDTPLYKDSVLQMGRTLLRAVQSINTSVLVRFVKVQNRRVSVPLLLHELGTQEVLPSLWSRCSGAQDLMHLCRCQVRMSLHDSWSLPHGITLLPLPTRLKRYLELQLD